MNYFLVSAAIAAADRLTKARAERLLAHGTRHELIKGRLSLHNLRNSGAAMGLFAENPRLLWLSSAFALANVLAHYRRLRRENNLDGAYKLSLALIIGGAAGNLNDRLQRGYVTDFIQLGNGPVFNLADVAVTLGAIIYGLRWLQHKPRVRLK